MSICMLKDLEQPLAHSKCSVSTGFHHRCGFYYPQRTLEEDGLIGISSTLGNSGLLSLLLFSILYFYFKFISKLPFLISHL